MALAVSAGAGLLVCSPTVRIGPAQRTVHAARARASLPEAPEVLVAEDTPEPCGQLMKIHGLKRPGRRPLIALSTTTMAPRRGRACPAGAAEGRSVAYCSEAGTPVVADPATHAGQRAGIEAGRARSRGTRATAAIMALSVRASVRAGFLLLPGSGRRRRARRAGIGRDSGPPQRRLILKKRPKARSSFVRELCESTEARCDQGGQLCGN